LRDRFEVRHRLARKADAALNTADEAARRVAKARRAGNLPKRLPPYDPAPRACAQAITLDDPRDGLRHLLRDACHLCAPHGTRRPPAGVRSALPRLLAMRQARDSAAVTHTLQPMRKHLAAMLVPCKPAEAIAAALRLGGPHAALDVRVLAWPHAHCSSQAGSQQTRAHQRARDVWLAWADALLDDAFDTLNARVCDQLDSLRRASSLVEMVNALMRPSLRRCKGQITHATLPLRRFYQNHRPDKSGTRQGKAPMALWTGKPLEAPWWELCHPQSHTERGVTPPGTGRSRPPLQLVSNNDRCPDRQAIAAGQTIVDPLDATEHDRRHKDSEAASAFHLCAKPHGEMASQGQIGPTSSHARGVTRQTVNSFRPVLKGAACTWGLRVLIAAVGTALVGGELLCMLPE
jgi:hypothetical protein